MNVLTVWFSLQLTIFWFLPYSVTKIALVVMISKKTLTLGSATPVSYCCFRSVLQSCSYGCTVLVCAHRLIDYCAGRWVYNIYWVHISKSGLYKHPLQFLASTGALEEQTKMATTLTPNGDKQERSRDCPLPPQPNRIDWLPSVKLTASHLHSLWRLVWEDV